MDLNRRTFLQAAGATASAAATAGAGGAASVTGAREAALNAGNGPYLVTWGKGLLEQCANYHDAVHRASILRHGFGIQTQHIRCTHGLLAQLKAAPNSTWLEVDGLALTRKEAEKYGFDLLRRARDPELTRRQLWQHHLEELRANVEREDLSDEETTYYSIVEGEPEQTAVERVQLIRIDDGMPREVHPCSPSLGEALQMVFAQDAPVPEINTTLTRHTTQEEHDARLHDDVRFRVAAKQPDEQKIAFAESGEPRLLNVQERDGWLFSRGNDDDTEPQSDPAAAKVSQHLSIVLKTNGFAMPGFWRRVDGVLHHLDEFADNVPEPELSGRTVRHQNRHT